MRKTTKSSNLLKHIQKPNGPETDTSRPGSIYIIFKEWPNHRFLRNFAILQYILTKHEMFGDPRRACPFPKIRLSVHACLPVAETIERSRPLQSFGYNWSETFNGTPKSLDLYRKMILFSSDPFACSSLHGHVGAVTIRARTPALSTPRRK